MSEESPESDREELLFAAGLALGILVATIDRVPMQWWVAGGLITSVWFYWLIREERRSE